MKHLPDQADLDHLKKQAKDLLRRYRTGDAGAIARFRENHQQAAGRQPDDIAGLGLHLHDAQSCIAREYGFASWSDLRRYVQARNNLPHGGEAAARAWLDLVYAGEMTGQMQRPRPALAARLLEEAPWLAAHSPYLACAAGDLDRLRQATSRDPGWVNRAGGPLDLPPLLAVTQSSLVQRAALADRLRDCAKFLIDSGADPNQRVGTRWPPASLHHPDPQVTLSTLYGAAGNTRDAAMTKLLLEAGADPNDGESLYHSLENPDCTRLLLQAGARIEGSNAIYRALDLDDAAPLELLLAHGGNASEPALVAPLTDWGSPLLWAIRRRRSCRHVAALLNAGADPQARTPDGLGAYTLARRFGLAEVADLLHASGGGEPLSQEDQFVSACAAADEAEARRIKAIRPDLPSFLSPAQLRLLPEIAASGARDAVMLMVRLGWPVAVRGGDWSASALNHAVFRGDASLTRFLLAQGAHWSETHGFGDDVRGTLSWASCNEPVEGGDWPDCARALLDAGMPTDGNYRFSEDVHAAVLTRDTDS